MNVKWCMGLPFARSRSITADETTRYTAELARMEARLKHQVWLFGLALSLTVIISFPFAFETSRLPGSDTLLVVFSLLGIWLLIGGVAGSVAEIVFGGRVSKILFAAALCGLVVALLFNQSWTQPVGAFSGVFVIIGGNAMAVRQFDQRRRTKRIARSLHEDLSAGEVWRFEPSPTAEENDASPSERSIDVFPVSNIVAAIGDKGLAGVNTADVATIPSGGTGTVDAPLQHFAPRIEDDRFDYRQRHLTDYEKSEIETLLRRERKTLVVRGAIQFWAAIAVVNALDASISHRSIDLNLKSAVIGIMLAVALMWNRARNWWRLRLDCADGTLVVIRPKESVPNSPTLEQLPRSGRIWSDHGAPAPWRVRRQQPKQSR